MAFAFNTPGSNNNASSSAKNENWRADAFLNGWFNMPGGKRIKLGAFLFYLRKHGDAQLCEMLDQPGVVENLPKYVTFDFQWAKPKDAGGENPFAFLAQPPATGGEAPFDTSAQA